MLVIQGKAIIGVRENIQDLPSSDWEARQFLQNSWKKSCGVDWQPIQPRNGAAIRIVQPWCLENIAARQILLRNRPHHPTPS